MVPQYNHADGLQQINKLFPGEMMKQKSVSSLWTHSLVGAVKASELMAKTVIL